MSYEREWSTKCCLPWAYWIDKLWAITFQMVCIIKSLKNVGIYNSDKKLIEKTSS